MRPKFIRKPKIKAKSRARRRRQAIPRRIQQNLGKHLMSRWCTVPSANVDTVVSAGVGGALTPTADSWVLRTGTTVNASYYAMGVFFSLGMLPDVVDYTSLFDQYKISAVLIKMTPFSTASNLQSGLVNGNQGLSCILHSVVDHDDYTAPNASSTGINNIRQYRTYRTRNLFSGNGIPHKRYLKPRVAMSAYGAGAFTQYANMPAPWIDSSYTTTQHYGVKYIWEVFQPDTTIDSYIWFKLEAKLYLTLREPI